MSNPFWSEALETNPFRSAFEAPSRKAAQEALSVAGKTMLRVSPPCGLTGGTFYTLNHLPHRSVPCPCGQAGCWLVFYEKEIK